MEQAIPSLATLAANNHLALEASSQWVFLSVQYSWGYKYLLHTLPFSSDMALGQATAKIFRLLTFLQY